MDNKQNLLIFKIFALFVMVSITKAHAIALLFALLALVCTIISFSTYWYKVEASVGGADLKVLISFMKENTQTRGIDQTKSWYESGKRNRERAIYGVCIAFVILSFISLLYVLVMGLIGALGGLNRFTKLRANLSIRLMNIVSMLFLLIAVLAFIRLPQSTNDDCKSNGPVYFPCNLYGCDSFYGGQSVNNDSFHWTPYIGWGFAIVAAFFNAFSVVISFFVSFQNTTGGATTTPSKDYQEQLE
ncbi:hypothetical protein PPL_04599 [Heterostelium album PN500]|uniref:Transmembrane protein n=1 Tax=Heterostelium pallidum (strain ATCC 26659 / Pp 5 / PN500) TaxID=670386 RepID=D3B809_HETP5|nr:hypothetical protein PPL_04599 [Heterostelium album PN500]EFA82177.1 hypothetical protein PPL_04599 [Heterostelium album PN500]|eukprot:XP_020434294.1 hypothetical protein PPL_04599 [Heterostelium album PN500]